MKTICVLVFLRFRVSAPCCRTTTFSTIIPFVLHIIIFRFFGARTCRGQSLIRWRPSRRHMWSVGWRSTRRGLSLTSCSAFFSRWPRAFSSSSHYGCWCSLQLRVEEIRALSGRLALCRRLDLDHPQCCLTVWCRLRTVSATSNRASDADRSSSLHGRVRSCCWNIDLHHTNMLGSTVVSIHERFRFFFFFSFQRRHSEKASSVQRLCCVGPHGWPSYWRVSGRFAGDGQQYGCDESGAILFRKL